MQTSLQIKYHNRWKVHPEKNGFEVQNPIFHIFFKIEFHIFLLKNRNPLELRDQGDHFETCLDKIACFNFLRN